MTLWMQFQRARRALGSMPVVGSSCNEEDSQVDTGPQVQQEAEGEGEEEWEEGHHLSHTLLPLWFLLLTSVLSLLFSSVNRAVTLFNPLTPPPKPSCFLIGLEWSDAVV